MLLRYFLAWFGMLLLAMINGGVRDAVYAPIVGALPAHQLATAMLLILFIVCIRTVMLYWPIASARRAWIIGGMWSILTLAFEFGIGRFVLGRPWSALLHDFDLLAGRVWVFIPLWVFLAPVILMRMKERRHLVS